MPARLLVPSWVSCHCDAHGTALSRTRVRASGERVAGTWAGVRLGPDKGPWVDWSVAVQGSWLAILPPGSDGGGMATAPGHGAAARVAAAGRTALQAHVSVWKRSVRWRLAR